MRAVVVGAGLMGRWHAHAIRRAGGRITAIVDPDPGRRALLSKVSGAPGVATLDQALAAGADFVHICAPLATHVDLASAALRAGCHVILEKPATPTGAEAMALADLATRADRLLVPVHQFGFQDGVEAIRARLSELGQIRHVAFVTCSAGASQGESPADRDVVAAEIVPHPLALAQRLLEVEMAALPWRLDRPAPGEWRFGAVSGSGVAIAGVISLSARPTCATLEILADHGSARADLFHGFAVFEPGSASRRYKILRPLFLAGRTLFAAGMNLSRRSLRGETAYPGLFALVKRAYAAAAGRLPPPIDLKDLVDVAVARDRLIELAARTPEDASTARTGSGG